MVQKTETLWQIGQSGKGSQEFVQTGGWQPEFTYIVGSDEDPINQPRMPSLLLVPGLETKPKRGRKQLFSTDKLHIQFSLAKSYNVGELVLFYDFYGSETDTLCVDGEPVAQLVGAGEHKLNRSQTPLPAIGMGTHTLTLTTAGGAGDGKHRIDYLRLDAVVDPKQPKTLKHPEKSPETSQKTMDTQNPTPTPPEPQAPAPVVKKSYIMTSQTGLQDYSYWSEYAQKLAKKNKSYRRPFRRGRIWA